MSFRGINILYLLALWRRFRVRDFI